MITHLRTRLVPTPILAALFLTASAASAQGPAVAGDWTGALAVLGAELRVVFHITPTASGELGALMDSPDQGAFGIPVTEVHAEGDSVVLLMPQIQGGFRGVLSGDTIAGEWSQGGVTVPLRLVRSREALVTRRRPQDPERPFPYTEEEVSFRNDAAGIDLAGTFTIPRGTGPFPAAVLISGSGPQNRDEEIMGHRPFLVLSDHLTRRGIAVLRFDDRGTGQSTGDFGSATSADFAEDVESAVRWLAARPEVAEGEIGLIGHSEGGIIAPMVASRTDRVAWVVLLAGPGVPGDSLLELQVARIAEAAGQTPEAVAEQLRQQRAIHGVIKDVADNRQAAIQLRPLIRRGIEEMPAAERERAGLTDPAAVDSLVERSSRQILSPWFRFFLGHDPRPQLRALDVPTLALLGERDLQVPADENARALRQALESSSSPEWDVRVLPELNHLFQHATTGHPSEYGLIDETMSQSLLEAVSGWIHSVTTDGPGT